MTNLLLLLILLILVQTPTVKKYSFSWYKKLDDTDNLETGHRSGLALYIDHGTGVHYIKTSFGSLIPRLDEDGNVVTEYKQEKIVKARK